MHVLTGLLWTATHSLKQNVYRRRRHRWENFFDVSSGYRHHSADLNESMHAWIMKLSWENPRMPTDQSAIPL